MIRPIDPKEFKDRGYTRDVVPRTWDDDYDIVPVGCISNLETEYWISDGNEWIAPDWSSTRTIEHFWCIHRKLKPGLIKALVK